MDVILLERIEKLGQMGDVVAVKPGYARNFLLPQKKAMRATKENIARFDGQRVQLEATNLEHRSEAEAVAAKVEGMTTILLRQASESQQLYGSVSSRDIAIAVNAEGFAIDRRQVQLSNPIKTLGLHQVRIALHPEVAVGISVNVARSEEEAEQLARGEIPAAGGGEAEVSEIEADEQLEVFEEGRETVETDAAESEEGGDAESQEDARDGADGNKE